MIRPSEVVSVIRHEVRPGSEDAYEAWARDIVSIGQTFPGHHGVTIMRPPPGTRVYTVVLHFDTVEHLRAWLDSDVRASLLERITPHLVHDGQVEIRPGLDFWLPAPGQPRAVPFRQFLLALAVIYPLSMLLPLVLRPLLSTAPALDYLPIRALLVSTLLVGLMTWVLMPRLTNLAGGWLYSGRK